MAAEYVVQTLNFTLYQGMTFNMVIRLSDSQTGEPLDYTGYVARSMMRVNYTDVTPAGTFTCVFTDAATGVLEMRMTDAETDALDFTKAYYDLEVEDAGGNVSRVLMGKVTLSRSATK